MNADLGARIFRGTLADLRTLMAHPPGMRRGFTEYLPPVTPPAGGGYTYTVDRAWHERLVSVTFSFAASAAAAQRSIVLNLTNPEGVLINQTALTPQIAAGETWVVSADLEQGGVLNGAPSQSNEGTVTSPAAGATIASLTLPAGEYSISWLVGVTGTIGAPEVNNFELTNGAALVAQSVNESSTTVNYPQAAQQVTIPAGGATVAVKAVGLGTVAAVYAAQLTATWISGNASYPQLPDIIVRSGWNAVLSVANVQAADQLSAVTILTERYSSALASGALEQDLENGYLGPWW